MPVQVKLLDLMSYLRWMSRENIYPRAAEPKVEAENLLSALGKLELHYFLVAWLLFQVSQAWQGREGEVLILRIGLRKTIGFRSE